MTEILVGAWAALIIANIWIAEGKRDLSLFWLGLSILFFFFNFFLV